MTLSLNTGLNAFFVYNLSRIYTINEDFRADIASTTLEKRIEADNIKIPPVKIVKFISAYAYDKPSQVVFTGNTLLIFVNLGAIKDLAKPELEAVISHEIGHYLLGHLDYFGPNSYTGASDFDKEIQADAFAAIYAGKSTVFSAVTKLVWDSDEKNSRLKALEKK